jgi:tetratricopeptide (TPR) repeat protein
VISGPHPFEWKFTATSAAGIRSDPQNTRKEKMRSVHIVAIGALLGFPGCFTPTDEPQGKMRAPKEQALPASAESLLESAKEEIRQSRSAKAELLVQQLLHIRDDASATYDPGLDTDLLALATTLDEMSIHLLDNQKVGEAVGCMRSALLIRDAIITVDDTAIAATLTNLASVYIMQERNAEAEPLLRRALRIKEELYGPNDPIVAEALGNLAASYSGQGKYAESDSLRWRALTIEEREFGLDDFRIGGTLAALANSCVNQGRFVEAERLYRRAIANWEKDLGPNHIMVSDLLRGLSKLKDKTGDRNEAESLRQRAEAIRANGIGYQGETLRQRNP